MSLTNGTADQILSDLADIKDKITDAEQGMDSLRYERDVLIRKAFDQKAPVRDIVRWSGLSRERVYQIRDGRR